VETRTEDFELEGRTYRASREDPRYVVESEGSGARAVHTGEALTEL
jgi:hypothetical protein